MGTLDLETPGICAQSTSGRSMRTPCSYTAAFDVFSMRVAMVELILGCLHDNQSTRNGNSLGNVYFEDTSKAKMTNALRMDSISS